MRIGLVGALAGLAVAGCTQDRVRAMYAQDFNCPEDQVVVGELDANRYRASGCNQAEVYTCDDGICYPPVEENREPETKVFVAVPVSQTPKARTGTDQKGVVVLDLPLPQRSMLKLRAAPEQHAELVQLKLQRVEDEAELEDCEIELLINGERVVMPKARFERKGVLSSLRSNVPRELISELGTAQKLALRACDLRWSLDDAQAAEVRDFVDRYEEELAWLRDPRKGTSGGLVAPAGGWPAWKPAGRVPAAGTVGKALEGEALFKLVAPSVVQIEALLSTGTAQGSGVAVSESDVLTNCHVLQGARKIILKQKKKEWVARVAQADPPSDRCIVSVSQGGLAPVRGVRPYADLKVGEALFTLGSPGGLELSLSNGILSGLREEASRSYVQTTAPISPGSSGGGLFDAEGNLVGITTLVFVGKHKLNQSLNFAIPAESYYRP